MIRAIFSILPLAVCLSWLLVFISNYKHLDIAKSTLVQFIIVCVVLYLCHALYFLKGGNRTTEIIWTFCSLTSFPIYYQYLCFLTSHKLSKRQLGFILLVNIVITTLAGVCPGVATDTIRKVYFGVLIFTVCIQGYRRLVIYDNKLLNIYSDTEGRETSPLKRLLALIIFTSICSVAANTVGRRFFLDNYLLFIPSVLFSTCLFFICYIGFIQTPKQIAPENEEEENADNLDKIPNSEKDKEDTLDIKIEQLMNDEHYYLTHNLTIMDVSQKVGACRTYISRYINTKFGCSFSDYINKMRVEHAKQLLLQSDYIKMIHIADDSGFSSEQSFYRNFNKFTGMSPSEWVKKNK